VLTKQEKPPAVRDLYGVGARGVRTVHTAKAAGRSSVMCSMVRFSGFGSRSISSALLLVAVGAIAACSSAGDSTTSGTTLFGAGSSAAATAAATSAPAASGTSGLSFVRAGCQTPAADAGADAVTCFAWQSVGDTAEDTTSDDLSPRGYGPTDLAAAYDVPTSLAPNATVAVVDAMDDPNAEADLAVYRTKFGLPACTTANGCFTKVGQSGGPDLPAADSGWAVEIALDLDMVSALCPSCSIVLVEATQATSSSLGVAENTAASFHPVAISNSWGGGESTSDPQMDVAYFDHPGVFITVSAGDEGYGAAYPATSAHVTAVGGTSLSLSSATSRGWTESAWSSGGSGCSAYTAKPSFQTDTGCKTRMAADVSAVADPQTGVAFYTTYGGTAAGAQGWLVAGGTSVASPVVAALFARTGLAARATNAFSYAHPGAFNDVTSGSNGSCGTYACNAGTGYDGPTGNGTPDGAAILAQLEATDAGAADGGTADAGRGTTAGTGTGTATGGGAPTQGDGGADSCSHDVCSTGDKLTRLCSTCAHAICEADSYCCLAEWDAVCVGEVASVCEQRCD
jgi:hypothetical protein